MCQLTSIVIQDKNKKDTTNKPQQEITPNTTIYSNDTNATPHTDNNIDGLVEDDDDDDDVKELLIIGADPHALTLLLRLLEPEPDFLTEKERSRRDHHTKNIRSIHDVRRHIKKLIRCGNNNNNNKSCTTTTRLKSNDNDQRKKKQQQRKKCKNKNLSSATPPPLQLNDVLENKISIVDMHGDWMSGWKENFDVIKIKQLRSLMNAHADPYDHRSLEYYAEMMGRDNELILLNHLTQRDKNFSGPYHTTTTQLFNDFHELLINSYGINNTVEKGYVESVCPKKSSDCNNNDEPIFEIKINYGIDNGGIKIVKSKRIVMALGPNCFSPTPPWQKNIIIENENKSLPHNRGVLSSAEIVPWLKKQKQQHNNGKSSSQKYDDENPIRILIIGGGKYTVVYWRC
jgi:hypothetical protein